jgi:hypothetical protein
MLLDGVYKAGFAKTQEAYQKAVIPLFDSLDRLEKMLTGKDYLVGGVLTEADIRLWVTIVRPGFYRSLVPLMTLCSCLDSFRSSLCRTLQVQHSHHPGWLPRHTLVCPIIPCTFFKCD